MKISLSIFAVSITVFFFFSLFSVAYSWIFYLSATIHKDYMFLFCNSLLVFICLNFHSSSVSPVKLEMKKTQAAAGYCESGTPGGRRIVGEVGDEKEMGLLHLVQVREDWILIAGDDDEKAGETETLSVLVQETCGGDYDDDEEVAEAMEDDKALSVLDELEVGEDDETLSVSVVEETKDDEFKVVEDDKTLSVIEETQDEVEVVVVEEDKTLSIVDETHGDDEQEQGGSIHKISIEELNKRCEEFIRKMKEDIRVEILTIQCH